MIPSLYKIKMLHQVNDGATRLFIQSSCFVGSFARCDPNKTVYISYMVVLSTRLSHPLRNFALLPFFDMAV